MSRRLVAVAAAVVLAACGGNGDARPLGPRADDVQLLARHLRQDHPNLFHDLSRERFDAIVADVAARADALPEDELLVEAMRIAALPGVRDGHTGIFPFDPAHARTLHAYPLRLYLFPDGPYVIAQVNGTNLVGARVVAVGGMPWERVAELVRPLVPHDNDSSLSARLPMYAVTAEVLHGLHVVDAVQPVTWTFEHAGARFDATLAPVTAAAYNAQFPDLFFALVPPGLPEARAPAYLARRNTPLWTTLLSRKRVWYVGYNLTRVSTFGVAQKLRRGAKAKAVRGIIVDLRNNPGGDNNTYGPLLDALRTLSRKEKIVVLISRATFSAAQNFATELERAAKPTFVGEASGGSPNLYGDATPTLLPAIGLDVYVATIYWQKSTASDPRVAIEPQVPVPLSAADYLAGRDPVLAAGIRVALSG